MVLHNVVRFRQGSKILYITSVPISQLNRFARVKTFEEAGGHQRNLDMKRVRKLTAYFKKSPFYVTGSLLMAADGSWNYEAYDKRRPDIGTLTVGKPIFTVDGQHRLYGAMAYQKEDIILPTIIYHHLTDEEMITAFSDTNLYQTKVDPSLVHHLNGHTVEARLATYLERSTASPFRSIVSLDGTKKGSRFVKLSTLEQSIEVILKGGKISALVEEQQKDIIESYFSLLHDILKPVWNKKSRLLTAYGLAFVAIVGKEVLQDTIRDGDVDWASLRGYCERLQLWNWQKTSETGKAPARRDALEFLKFIYSQQSA